MPSKKLLDVHGLDRRISLLDYREQEEFPSSISCIKESLDNLVRMAEKHRVKSGGVSPFCLSRYVRQFVLRPKKEGKEKIDAGGETFYHLKVLYGSGLGDVLFHAAPFDSNSLAIYYRGVITIYRPDPSTIRHEVGHSVFEKLPSIAHAPIRSAFCALQAEHETIVRNGHALSRAVALTTSLSNGIYSFAEQCVPNQNHTIYFQSKQGDQSIGRVIGVRHLSDDEVRIYRRARSPSRSVKKTVVLRPEEDEAFAETFAFLMAPEKEAETFPLFRYVTLAGANWYMTMVDVLRTYVGINRSAVLAGIRLRE